MGDVNIFQNLALGLRWSMERRLYTKLKDNPNLLTGNSLMQGFVNQHENLAIGLFYDIRKEVENLYNVDPATQNTLDNNDLIIENSRVALRAVDSLLLTNHLDSLLHAQRDSLVNLISQKLAENTAIYNTLQNQRVLDANAIITSNDAVSTTFDYETNEKDLNDIYLKGFVQGNLPLNSTQITTIDNIANQCVEEGGPEVYRARSMKAWLTGIPVQDVQCVGERDLKKEENTEIAVLPKIFPNPVKDNLTIIFPTEWTKQPGIISFQSITGQLIHRLDYEKGAREIHFNVEGFVKGIYFLEIRTENDELHLEKIILTND